MYSVYNNYNEHLIVRRRNPFGCRLHCKYHGLIRVIHRGRKGGREGRREGGRERKERMEGGYCKGEGG